MKRILAIIALTATALTLAAQPGSDCPGWHDPSSFNVGGGQYFWSARVGERVYPQSSTDTTTGYYVMSTCASPNAPAITGHNNITSSTYNTGSDAGINCCNDGNIWDALDCRFKIITQAEAGLDQFTINGSNGMQRIPPGHTSSIRLGDPRAAYAGNSASTGGSHTWSASHTNKGSEALFYTMKVTSRNALLFVNYAVVGRCYSHTAREAGEFLIRVVKQNADGTWPNQPVNDSLWFKVSAPALPSNNQPVAPWVMGRPGSICSSTTCGYVYKPWTKVAINLNDYIYETVRIEMYTSDCIYDVDPLYAYIAGDFQPMTVRTTGCPDATSSVIDTLKAPAGMISYQWFVATQGAESPENFFNQSYMDNVHFRQIYPTTGTTTDSIFAPTVQHFVVTEGSNRGDTVPEQTFLCIMTSAMDPAKPFSSKLYANVTNSRPLVNQRYESSCDGSVTFYNQSRCFGTASIATDRTEWVVYRDAACTQPLDTLRSDTATYHFSAPGIYGVRLFCYTETPNGDDSSIECVGSNTFTCRALGVPHPQMTLNRHILCNDERLFGRCTNLDNPSMPFSATHNITWQIGDTTIDDVDTVLLNLPFGTHPVIVTVTDGDNCSATVTDTVNVYGTPTVGMGADVGAVCVGDTVTITAEGNARYVWSSTPPDTSLDSQQGQSTIHVAPVETTVYILQPVAENPCSSEGATILVEVVPTPTPDIWLNANNVSIDYPTVSMTDISNDRAATFWRFSDGQEDEGVNVSHTFTDLGGDSVSIRMTTCNRLECCADTTVSLPVHSEGIWFPNAFTPSLTAEDNNRFRIVSTFPLLQFEIYIYNRTGHLVYTSTDPSEGWDGNDLNGQACPQGAYVYYYRYSRLGIDDFYPGAGTVTLIR